MDKSVALKHAKRSGFSLIELMIVVAIIGILAAVAYPSYTRYVIKSNRASAQAFMLNVSNRQEQYILDARQYATAADIGAIGTALNVPVPSDVSKYYAMTITNVGSNVRTYLIEATPIAGTMQANDDTLQLDNLGQKNPAGKW